MILIVDSNRILSALIKNGATRKILSSEEFQFYALDYVLAEVTQYKEYVMKKSRMNLEQVELLFILLLQNITIVSDEKVKSKMKEAIKIMGNIDINDSPILACALAIQNDGIWTEDKHFQKQNKVKIWKTKDLINIVQK